MKPQKLIRNDKIKTKLIETTGAIQFTGKSMVPNADKSQALWEIERAVTSGTLKTSDIIGNSFFDQIWDDRETIFPPLPFLNIFSTLFDGVNDTVIIPDANNLRFENNTPFTISLWFKTTSTSTFIVFLSKADISQNNRGYEAIMTSGKIRLNITNNSTANNRVIIETLGQFNDGDWHHLIAKYDGSLTAAGAEIHVDNVLRPVTVVSDNLSATIIGSSKLYLGSRENSVGFFLGNLDSMSLFDIDVSNLQIAELNNSGTPGDLSQLSFVANGVSWWRMGDNDAAPTILDNFDLNNGTMTGFAIPADAFVEDVA